MKKKSNRVYKSLYVIKQGSLLRYIATNGNTDRLFVTSGYSRMIVSIIYTYAFTHFLILWVFLMQFFVNTHTKVPLLYGMQTTVAV